MKYEKIVPSALGINKIATNNFKNNLSFGVDFTLQVPLPMDKINTHNMGVVRSYTTNDWIET